MIRINLLPAAKKQARGAASSGGGGATSWIIGYAATAAVVGVVLGFLYMDGSNRLGEWQSRNRQLDQQIQQLSRQSANIDEVRAQLARSQQLEEVVTELQRARFGPTRVMMELAHILSVSGGPTIDPARLDELRRGNPLAGFNPAWDTRRLWLTQFEEEQRHVTMRGVGKTNEDVAEFLRRLSLSDSFSDVRLERTQAHEDRETHLDVIEFEITCDVRY